MSRMTAVNGSANTMVAVCTALTPPASSRLMAMPATSTPQMTFTRGGGFSLPPVLIMPSTRVAESPEVTKNTSTSTVATPVMRPPSGSASNTLNSAVDTSALTASAMGRPCRISMFSAVPPNTENQTKAASVGASTVPRMNSRMLRPRETRAMNRPTNGDQLTHQAQ